MLHEYYDDWTWKKAFKNKDNSLEYTINKMKAYIVNYPYDYKGHSALVKLLIDSNNLEEASKYLEKIKPDSYIFSSCTKKKNNDFKLRMFDMYYDNLLRLKIYDYDYERAYELINKCKYLEEKANPTFLSIKYYLETNLGIDDNVEFKKGFSYLRRQIKKYSNDLFLEHIKKHQNLNGNNTNMTFNNDFNINDVLLELEKIIPNEKHNNKDSYIFNNYIFKYDNCGKNNNKVLNYFEVVTLKDSNKFITMYPCSYGENYDYIDLEYLKEKRETKVKVKRLSQIDKFKKRYNI